MSNMSVFGRDEGCGETFGYSWEKKDTKASRVTSNQGPTAPQS